MKNRIKKQIVWILPIFTMVCSFFYIGVAVEKNVELLSQNDANVSQIASSLKTTIIK
ncbi:MAG: hypothetical protein AB8B74_05650 [Crocinitomicaceae bacterium]